MKITNLIILIVLVIKFTFANYGIKQNWQFLPYPYQVHSDKFEEIIRKKTDILNELKYNYQFKNKNSNLDKDLLSPFNVLNNINFSSVANQENGDVSYQLGGSISAEVIDGLSLGFQINAGHLLTYNTSLTILVQALYPTFKLSGGVENQVNHFFFNADFEIGVPFNIDDSENLIRNYVTITVEFEQESEIFPTVAGLNDPNVLRFDPLPESFEITNSVLIPKINYYNNVSDYGFLFFNNEVNIAVPVVENIFYFYSGSTFLMNLGHLSRLFDSHLFSVTLKGEFQIGSVYNRSKKFTKTSFYGERRTSDFFVDNVNYLQEQLLFLSSARYAFTLINIKQNLFDIVIMDDFSIEMIGKFLLKGEETIIRAGGLSYLTLRVNGLPKSLKIGYSGFYDLEKKELLSSCLLSTLKKSKNLL